MLLTVLKQGCRKIFFSYAYYTSQHHLAFSWFTSLVLVSLYNIFLSELYSSHEEAGNGNSREWQLAVKSPKDTFPYRDH